MTRDALSERRDELVAEIRQVDEHIASLQNQLAQYQQTRLVRSGQLLEVRNMIDARSKDQSEIEGGDDDPVS